MRVIRIVSAVVVLCLFALAGCSRGPRMVEVEGIVTVRGKPIDRIQVEFWPVGDGPRSIGETDKEGRFKLSSDDGKRKGAVVGAHKVVLRDVGILGDKFLGRAGETVDMAKGKKPRIAASYSDPHTTPVKKDVTSSKNMIEIDLGS